MSPARPTFGASYPYAGLETFGSGTLTLGVAGSYAGNTIVGADGTLAVGNAGAIPSGPNMGNVDVEGTLDLMGNSITVNGLSGSGTVTSAPRATSP